VLNKQQIFISGLASLILLIAAVLSLNNGSVALTDSLSFESFGTEGLGSEVSATSQIFYQLRFPRVLLVMLVGGALALSGAVMQAVFRNPLADPGLIGVSAGSALGMSFAMVVGPLVFGAELSPAFLGMSAFVFGMAAMLIVYSIAVKEGQSQVATLLLAGVALSAFCTALSALLIYLSNDQQLRGLSFWNMGSFGGSSWAEVKLAALLMLPGCAILLASSRSLNLLLLGEVQARHLGLNVELTKVIAFTIVALLVSLSVSMVGVIGFVGLVVPHIVRILFGAEHKFLLLMSLIVGALLLLLADTFARIIISPAELPIGILTALIGCPFFVFLLIQYRKQVIF
jgi:iron complex transport system permease protein